jgi:lipoprotein-anchoring transpeptidase ErfK/SrfK
MEVVRSIRRWVLVAAVAMLATVAASAYVHRPAGPRILAAQDVPPAVRLKPAPTARIAAEPPPSPYVIRSVLPIDGPMKIGESHWDESAAPAKGTLVITVDLAAQVLSVFRDGHEIGASAILYGADAKPTPLGVYPITQKDADHKSNIYDGAPMPYMLRLTNDGVAIHASDVQDGYMTHGCIGVPKDFARRLFAVAKLGDRVIVTRGETLSVGKPVGAI